MTTTTTTQPVNVTVDGGVKFALNTINGTTVTFATELEARAARVRRGGGQVFRL